MQQIHKTQEIPYGMPLELSAICENPVFNVFKNPCIPFFRPETDLHSGVSSNGFGHVILKAKSLFCDNIICLYLVPFCEWKMNYYR